MSEDAHQLHSETELTMTDLCTQVGEWSLRNFKDKQASDYGVVEELGELAHCILKRFQGIRGFDQAEHFDEKATDALADTGIFLLNIAGTNGLLLKYTDFQSLPLGFTERKCMTQLLMGAAVLLEFTEYNAPVLQAEQTHEKEILQNYLQKIWDWTHMLAFHFGYDFRAIVTKTWLRVRQRDWEKHKLDADTQVVS